MSGGSFDYLYGCHELELFERERHLEMMVEKLTELGFIEQANETKRILETIEFSLSIVKERKDKLRDIWKDVEWYTSGDILLESLEKYKTKELLNPD